MRTLTEEEIRKRAYELWKVAEQNKPYIKMDAFWYQAEKELLAERAAEESWSRAPNVAHHRVVRRRRGTVHRHPTGGH
jgi:Protein of unknown function (DUF2934)